MKYLWLCAALLPLYAEGFNSCTLPQSRLTLRQGVERPTDPAYDRVCVALLPPTCRNYTVDRQPCAYRQCLVMDNVTRCPDGSPTVFTSVVIEPFTARTARRFTQADFAAMNAQIDAEAKRIAAKWTDNGRVPLAPGALTVIQNMSCQMVASANPDIQCVPRP